MCVVCNRLTEITCPNDNQFIFLVQAKDPSDLIVKALYIVSVTLLTKASEIV